LFFKFATFVEGGQEGEEINNNQEETVRVY